MRAPLPSRALLFAFLSIPFLAACSSAAPPEAQAPPTVNVAPAQAGAAPGEGLAVAGNTNGGAQTVMPPVEHGPPVTPGPTPAPAGAGGPDQDSDGIADASDRCPDVPEDRDGFEDLDGCPEIDNDKDGIADMNDMCPNQPENKNGRKDEDGCPD